MSSMVLGSSDPSQILLQDGILSSGFTTDQQFSQPFCDFSTTLNTSTSALQSTSQEGSPNKLPVDMNAFDMTFMSPQKNAISLIDKSILSPKSLFSPSTPTLKLKSPPSILRKRKRSSDLFGEGTPTKKLLQSPQLFGSPCTPSKFLLSPSNDKLFSPLFSQNLGSAGNSSNNEGVSKPQKSQVIKKLNFDPLMKENINPQESGPAPVKTTPGKVKSKK